MCDANSPAPVPPASLTSRRWRRLAIGSVVALLLAVGTVAVVRTVSARSGQDAHVVRLHTAAPRFDLPTLRAGRQRVALSELAGRPVVVNFWASWCVPCRQEMRGFEALHQQLGDRVAFVGVDTNDDRSDALGFAKQVGVTYDLAFDPGSTVAPRYDVFGLPTTIFIDAHGVMLERRLGAMSQAELEATIKSLLHP
jgi:cytochrome c biogenesis protein CcmG, thiol:disulfide interchange protein DsbE